MCGGNDTSRAGQSDFLARDRGLACVHPDSKKWLYRFFDSLHVPGPFRGRERFCASRAGPVCAPRSAFSGKSRPPPGNFKKELERTGAVCYNYLVLLGPPCPRNGTGRSAPALRTCGAPERSRFFKEMSLYMKLGIVENEPVSETLRKRTNADKA